MAKKKQPGRVKPLKADVPQLHIYLGKERKRWLAEYCALKETSAAKVVQGLVDRLREHVERTEAA